jgi:hypothetical protein
MTHEDNRSEEQFTGLSKNKFDGALNRSLLNRNGNLASSLTRVTALREASQSAAREDCTATPIGGNIADIPYADYPGGPSPMPKTRKSLDEQAEELRQKKEVLEKRLEAIEARKRESDRKLDTRRKIIIGGAVLAHAEIDTEFRRALQAALQKSVAEKDRPILADLVRPDSGKSPAAGHSASRDGATASSESPAAEPPPSRPTRPGPPSSGKAPPAPGQAG